MSNSGGSNNVRVYKGEPPLTSFMGSEGTPIVIDLLTGAGWYIDKGVPKPLRPYNLYTEQNHAGIGIQFGRAISIGAGWTPIINYDRKAGQFNVGYDYDLAAGTLTPEMSSDTLVGINLDFSFDETNGDRSFNFRAFDVTDGIASLAAFRVPVGRNTTGAAVGQSLMIYVKGGHTYRLEVGDSPDVFTGVNLLLAQFNAVDTVGRDLNNVFVPTGHAFSSGFSAGFQ